MEHSLIVLVRQSKNDDLFGRTMNCEPGIGDIGLVEILDATKVRKIVLPWSANKDVLALSTQYSQLFTDRRDNELFSNQSPVASQEVLSLLDRIVTPQELEEEKRRIRADAHSMRLDAPFRGEKSQELTPLRHGKLTLTRSKSVLGLRLTDTAHDLLEDTARDAQSGVSLNAIHERFIERASRAFEVDPVKLANATADRKAVMLMRGNQCPVLHKDDYITVGINIPGSLLHADCNGTLRIDRPMKVADHGTVDLCEDFVKLRDSLQNECVYR